jgi:hypothetical protein
MGFKRQKIRVRVEFDSGPYEGLWVEMRALTVGGVTDLMGLASVDVTDGVAVGRAAEPMIEVFSENLLDWNLEEEDGTPIPATRREARGIHFAMMVAIFQEWISGETGVSAPLETRPPAGVAGLPMTPLPSSQPPPDEPA